jgi:hypothetical protein
MTRCVCCNHVLSDYEATLKHGETGEYLDTCTECLSEIQALVPLTTIDNPSLLHKDNTEDAEGHAELDSL